MKKTLLTGVAVAVFGFAVPAMSADLPYPIDGDFGLQLEELSRLRRPPIRT